MGYFYALKQGAEFIFDTDDDNIPKKKFLNLFSTYSKNFEIYDSIEHEAINIYKYFTEKNIWPRGLPLTSINNYAAIN